MPTQRYRPGVWYYVSGDIHGMRYGCTLAMFDGDTVRVRQIQPVAEYVGDTEGAAVGYPFWSKKASYCRDDIRAILNERNELGWAPLDYVGADIPPDAKLTRDVRVAVACAALDYGWCTTRGPSGWSRDVLPRRLARSYGTPTRADGYEADREYRRLVRDARR